MEVRPGYKQTEVGVIPEDWEAMQLGQTALLKNGYAFKSETYDSLGDFKIITIANVQDGFMDATECSRIVSLPPDLQAHQQLRVGDIVISMTGNVGRVCRVTEPSCLLNQRVGKLAPTCVDADMLFFLLGQRRFITSMGTKAKGGAQGNLSVTDITEFQFAVPPTDAEQRAIAAALSDVDALLGGLDRLIAKRRDLKQAAMQQLMTGKTRLPGYTGEWEAVEFGDIAVVRNAKVVASSTPDGTRCVELEHIDQGTGRLLTSAEATGLGSKYSFRKGDVLFGRLRAYLRKYWLAAFDGVCSTEIWPLIARDGRLDGSFLYWVVQTNDFMNSAGLSYGTHMPRSDWSVLKNLPLRLPPVPEQSAIDAVLSDMDAELAALETRRAKTRDLKQAMMQELLTGKTRLVKPKAAHA